jgi:tripartite-type tricarboxylate transporter receptor subunit TctC
MKCHLRTAALLLFALGAAATAYAKYPDRSLRLVVPYPPGGNIDATGRIVAKGLAHELGQPVVVDNRAGASGLVGAEIVARAPADGYTVLLASTGALAVGKAFKPTMSLNPVRDFVSAGPIARAPLLLVINPKVPARNLQEFIAYARAHPGKLSMATAGVGTTAHLTGELFQSMSGTRFLHVPYKGSSPAIADLLGGQVDLTFDQPASTLAYIKDGELNALGVTSPARSSSVPDVPTLAESGLPGFDSSTTTGLMFPAGTPQTVLDTVNNALRRVLQEPEVRRQIEALGSDVIAGSGADFEHMLSAATRQWTAVIKEANIPPQ